MIGRDKKYRWLLLFVLVLGIAGTIGAATLLHRADLPPLVSATDCTARSSEFDCWKDRYKILVEQDSPKAAFADLRQTYEKYDYVRSQCHQIVHVIGRTAAAKYEDTVVAYDHGDNFCWSGYYHGVMEGIASKLGAEEVVTQLTTICTSSKQKHPYGFYHYNCVHGLGHGLMAVNSNELFTVLELCKRFSDQWERESCYSGTFMENIMSSINSTNHPTKYIKADDPLYPCTAVENEHKQQCYLMQTSHALSVLGGDFSKVFTLCANVQKPLDETCYQSLGRDASGRSVSNIAATNATCMLGQSDSAQTNCVIGAVKDFISYYHNDSQAMELCRSFSKQDLQETCTTTTKSYYETF